MQPQMNADERKWPDMGPAGFTLAEDQSASGGQPLGSAQGKVKMNANKRRWGTE